MIVFYGTLPKVQIEEHHKLSSPTQSCIKYLEDPIRFSCEGHEETQLINYYTPMLLSFKCTLKLDLLSGIQCHQQTHAFLE